MTFLPARSLTIIHTARHFTALSTASAHNAIWNHPQKCVDCCALNYVNLAQREGKAPPPLVTSMQRIDSIIARFFWIIDHHVHIMLSSLTMYEFNIFIVLALYIVNKCVRLKKKKKKNDPQHVRSSASLFFVNNYRATLCVSAVISVARCLSVCPSRWCIVSKRLNISPSFFHGSVAPSF